MHRIIAIFHSETIYFSDRISPHARRIFASNIFKSISSPFMTTFLNAFVFRATGTLTGVALYNIGLFIFLPIAFYLNGLLLRHVHIRKTFAIGAMLAGAASFAFVLAGPPNSFAVFLYGCLWGLGNGFYWANRNFIEFQETMRDMRQYFYGLISSITSISNIVIPFLAGWFIVIGVQLGLYTPRHAYWMLFGFAFLLLLICGTIIYFGKFDSPIPQMISRLHIKPFWNVRRLLSVASGFTDGTTSFTPILLVLLVVGNEGVLGSITAIVSIATAIAMYIYGRYVHIKHEYRTILAASTLFFVSTLSLVLLPGKIGVMLHVLLVGISASFYAMIVSPILLSLSETDMGSDSSDRYSFTFDNEVFLNLGRLMGVAVVLTVSYLTSQSSALVYGSIFVGAIHLALIVIFIAIQNKKPVTINS